MIDCYEVKHTKITRQQIIRETAKTLGNEYTIAEVDTIYNAIKNVIGSHLAKANDDNTVTCNLGDGLSLSAKIRQVSGYPRIWYSARFTRYRNRVLNELV